VIDPLRNLEGFIKEVAPKKDIPISIANDDDDDIEVQRIEDDEEEKTIDGEEAKREILMEFGG